MGIVGTMESLLQGVVDMMQIQFFVLSIGFVLTAARGFYLDVIKRDSVRATYSIAWMGVFLAGISFIMQLAETK